MDKIPMSESELKSTVDDYLQYQQNLGKLWFTRLNCGTAYVKKGNKYYAIQLCNEGTADFLVIKKTEPKLGIDVNFSEAFFFELKSAQGKQTTYQKNFEEQVQEQGCKYFVLRNMEELEKILAS